MFLEWDGAALPLRPRDPAPRAASARRAGREPLYVLVDKAIVGHLGTTQLAALAIAATVLSSAFAVFNFLTYGTTARVARLHGAGHAPQAARVGSQALWLGLFAGLGLLVLLVALARPAATVMGGSGAVGDVAPSLPAVLWRRIDQRDGFLGGEEGHDPSTPSLVLL